MKDIILIGKQGSGKGTQGKILAAEYGYEVFETGGALRAMAQKDTELGHEVKEITSRGDLVSNEIVMAIVADFLTGLDPSTPVIFDGIPRSLEQQKSLAAELDKAGRSYLALEITLPTDEAIKRMLERGKLEGRADDNLLSIQKRLENFGQFTQPVIDNYEAQGVLLCVDGLGSLEEVTAEIKEVLELS